AQCQRQFTQLRQGTGMEQKKWAPDRCAGGGETRKNGRDCRACGGHQRYALRKGGRRPYGHLPFALLCFDGTSGMGWLRFVFERRPCRTFEPRVRTVTRVSRVPILPSDGRGPRWASYSTIFSTKNKPLA